MNSVVAIDHKTNNVVRISHVQVFSQRALQRNLRITNKAGSRFIGKNGGPQGDHKDDFHAHLTMFRGAVVRQSRARQIANTLWLLWMMQ
jgi:hypothetical protein